MKSLRKILFNLNIIIGLELVIQLVFLVIAIYTLYKDVDWFYGFGIVLSIAVVIWIISSNQESEYKIAWITFVAVLPVFGGLFYIGFSGNKIFRRETKRMTNMEIRIKDILNPNDDISTDDETEKQMLNYLQNYGPYTAYNHQKSEYFEIGELYFARLKEELEKAEKFIFMEYFIIEEGVMWNEILDILVEKVNAGVDVRVTYDDMGSGVKLPNFYTRKLEKQGIKCAKFNPLIPVISSRYNTRDHRKITVIDGKVGFTGGINLADEYINKIDKIGHWKDMGVMIEGDAVWNFTVMFLTMWDYIRKENTDVNEYKGNFDETLDKDDGVVIPYSDNPLDNESVGENVYLNLINKAERYVYITTPYLIVSQRLLFALCNASKNGIDVKIITPYKPDKWYVHAVTRSYYKTLVDCGVDVYEYKPGFIHGKNYVVDDKYAVVGTINMDFRSLFLHFECGVLMMKVETILDARDDFLETVTRCVKVTKEDIASRSKIRVLTSQFLRVFAPLM